MLETKGTTELTTSQWNSSLNARLLAYATAATGAAAFVLGSPAQAQIVFTSSDITTGSSTALDLNNDGVPDFTFESVPYDSDHGHDFGIALDVVGNAVLGAGNPLKLGARIGPSKGFTTSTYYGVVFMGENFEYGTITNSEGVWKGVKNKFVGFKFLISGEDHYGWARLSGRGAVSVYVSGFAYETVPNKGIRAGQISEGEGYASFISSPDVAASVSLSLGSLAAGAVSIPVSRRNMSPSQ